MNERIYWQKHMSFSYYHSGI